MIGRGVCVENDTTIGAFTKIQSNAYITAYCTLEEHVFIAPCVVTTNDNFMGRTERRHALIKGAVIRRGARVGGGATLLPGIEIGEEAFVGAGAVVVRDVPPRVLVVGEPRAGAARGAGRRAARVGPLRPGVAVQTAAPVVELEADRVPAGQAPPSSSTCTAWARSYVACAAVESQQPCAVTNHLPSRLPIAMCATGRSVPRAGAAPVRAPPGSLRRRETAESGSRRADTVDADVAGERRLPATTTPVAAVAGRGSRVILNVARLHAALRTVGEAPARRSSRRRTAALERDAGRPGHRATPAPVSATACPSTDGRRRGRE